MGGPNSPSQKKEHSSPHFSTHVYCGQTVAHISATAEHLFVMNLHVICFILCRSSSSDYCPPQFLLREHFHCTACVPQVRCFAKCGHLWFVFWVIASIRSKCHVVWLSFHRLLISLASFISTISLCISGQSINLGTQELWKTLGPYCKLKGPLSTCSYL